MGRRIFAVCVLVALLTATVASGASIRFDSDIAALTRNQPGRNEAFPPMLTCDVLTLNNSLGSEATIWIPVNRHNRSYRASGVEITHQGPLTGTVDFMVRFFGPDIDSTAVPITLSANATGVPSQFFYAKIDSVRVWIGSENAATKAIVKAG